MSPAAIRDLLQARGYRFDHRLRGDTGLTSIWFAVKSRAFLFQELRDQLWRLRPIGLAHEVAASGAALAQFSATFPVWELNNTLTRLDVATPDGPCRYEPSVPASTIVALASARGLQVPVIGLHRVGVRIGGTTDAFGVNFAQVYEFAPWGFCRAAAICTVEDVDGALQALHDRWLMAEMAR